MILFDLIHEKYNNCSKFKNPVIFILSYNTNFIKYIKMVVVYLNDFLHINRWYNLLNFKIITCYYLNFFLNAIRLLGFPSELFTKFLRENLIRHVYTFSRFWLYHSMLKLSQADSKHKYIFQIVFSHVNH